MYQGCPNKEDVLYISGVLIEGHPNKRMSHMIYQGCHDKKYVPYIRDVLINGCPELLTAFLTSRVSSLHSSLLL